MGLQEKRNFTLTTGKKGVIEIELATLKAALLYGKNELCEEDLEVLENKRKRLEEEIEEGRWVFNGLDWTKYEDLWRYNDPPILDPNEDPLLKELRKENREGRKESIENYLGTNQKWKVTNGMVQRITGLLASSILPENEKDEWLAKLPDLYIQESWNLHEYLLNNQACPITQMGQFSNKGVDSRLDYVMSDEKL